MDTSSKHRSRVVKAPKIWRCVAPLMGGTVAYDGGTPQVLQHLIACATAVAPQLRPRSTWSPEKRLAGTVVASALVEIRDFHDDRGHGRSVRQNLEWVASDDSEWPFSFVRLCQLFDLEPSWVRMIVRRWVTVPSPADGSVTRRFESTRGTVTQMLRLRDNGLVCGPRTGSPADAVRRLHEELA